MGDGRDPARHPPVQATGDAVPAVPGRAHRLRYGREGSGGGHRAHQRGGGGENRLDEGVGKAVPGAATVPGAGGYRPLHRRIGEASGGIEGGTEL